MTIYHPSRGEPYVRLEEVPALERALLLAWLAGQEGQPAAGVWLADFLRFKAEKRRHDRAAPDRPAAGNP